MRRSAALIGTLVALAAYASWQWFALVAEPPIGRWAALIALALALAAALDGLSSVGRPPARRVLAGALVAAALVAGLGIAGLEVRLLAPGNWAELQAELDSGLAGVSQVELPYDGPNGWTTLGILLAAPIVVIGAVALALWPSSAAARARRTFAMVTLVALYGFSVTWEAPSSEALRGLALLILLAAYIWLPRGVALPRGLRRPLTGAVALAVAGGAATALASGVEGDDPLVDYRGWAIFGAERDVRFDWNHSYGPFEWPQRGTTLLEIRSDRPLLWRTSVLDSFDGSRWLRGGAPDVPGVPTDLAGASTEMVDSNRKRGWSVFPGIEVQALSSDLIVGAGVTRQVNGIETYSLDPDGVALLGSAPLTEGDSYSIEGYSPDPSARQLRRADGRYPRGLARYVALTLPYGAEALGTAPPVAPLVSVVAPLRGSRAADRSDPVGEVVAGTAYERVHALARRLTRRADTAYEAVSAIEAHLRSDEYRYKQDVPLRRNPLPAFLFMDREGYCQQFSGAMALMLRMVGIPARVATGFSPGYRQPDGNVYSVRDTDAHSWVEVWFRDIGWVAFDPTPGAAPAEAQSLAAFRGQSRIARFGAGRALSIERAAEAGPAGRGVAAAREGQGLAAGAVLLGMGAIGALLGMGLTDLRRRRMLRPEGAGYQLRELERALPRLGYEVPPAATLLEIERRLRPVAGRSAARYVAGLRANRYAAGRPRRPGPVERRALRRSLAQGSGPRRLVARWRAWRAIPPGGPRR